MLEHCEVAKQIKNTKEILQSFRSKYPNMIPVFLQACKQITLKKSRMLVSEAYNGLQFRKQLAANVQHNEGKGLYIFVVSNGKCVMLNQLMELKDAFKKFAHNEGYLQLKLEAQQPF